MRRVNYTSPMLRREDYASALFPRDTAPHYVSCRRAAVTTSVGPLEGETGAETTVPRASVAIAELPRWHYGTHIEASHGEKLQRPATRFIHDEPAGFRP